MPVTHSPPRSQLVPMAKDGTLTLQDLYDMVYHQTEDIKKSQTQMEIKLENVSDRLTHMEKTYATMEPRIQGAEKEVEKVWEEVKTIKQNLADQNDDLQKLVKEEAQKLIKRNNLVLIGVPETPEGFEKVKSLLQLILPDHHINIINDRLGKPRSDEKPRPLRITLNTFSDKLIALNNCKLLKNKQEFKGISVKSDLTKRQLIDLQERKVTNGVHTYHTRGKRNADHLESGPSSKKPNLTEDEDAGTMQQD